MNLCWNENNENPTSALDWIWIESVKFLGSWLTDLTVMVLFDVGFDG